MPSRRGRRPRSTRGKDVPPRRSPALGVQFVVEASAPMEGEVLKVMVRLVDAPIERKVWVGEYDVAPAELSARAARIASDMAAAALAYPSAR